MGTKLRQWLQDVASRVAAQAVVTLLFATIPIMLTIWEWRGIIVNDHRRQQVLDSLLVRHLQDHDRIEQRVSVLEWKRQSDSLRIDIRFGDLERNVDLLKRTTIKPNKSLTSKE